MVGLRAMAALQTATLILTRSTGAARQWVGEPLDKTTLAEDQMGEYTGLDNKAGPSSSSTATA